MISYAGEVIFSGEELIVRGSIKTREEKPAMITEVSAGKPATHPHDTKPKRTKTAINTHTQVYRLPLSSQPSPDSPGYQYFSAVSPANTSKEKTPKEFLVTSNDYAPFLSFSSTIFPSRIPHPASRITRHAKNKSPPTTNGEMVKW